MPLKKLPTIRRSELPNDQGVGEQNRKESGTVASWGVTVGGEHEREVEGWFPRTIEE